MASGFDDFNANLTVPFPFSFYNTTYSPTNTTFSVNSNGYISFNGTTGYVDLALDANIQFLVSASDLVIADNGVRYQVLGK